MEYFTEERRIFIMNEYRIMKILRESRNFSQEYIAGKLGINQNAYSKLENGKVKITLERIRQLAEIYDVKPYPS